MADLQALVIDLSSLDPGQFLEVFRKIPERYNLLERILSELARTDRPRLQEILERAAINKGFEHDKIDAFVEGTPLALRREAIGADMDRGSTEWAWAFAQAVFFIESEQLLRGIFKAFVLALRKTPEDFTQPYQSEVMEAFISTLVENHSFSLEEMTIALKAFSADQKRFCSAVKRANIGLMTERESAEAVAASVKTVLNTVQEVSGRITAQVIAELPKLG